MKDFNLINEIVAPYYNQFEQLGAQFDEESISYEFLKKARSVFARQFFFEIKLLLKAENRVIRREFKERRRMEREQLKRSKGKLKPFLSELPEKKEEQENNQPLQVVEKKEVEVIHQEIEKSTS